MLKTNQTFPIRRNPFLQKPIETHGHEFFGNIFISIHYLEKIF